MRQEGQEFVLTAIFIGESLYFELREKQRRGRARRSAAFPRSGVALRDRQPIEGSETSSRITDSKISEQPIARSVR